MTTSHPGRGTLRTSVDAPAKLNLVLAVGTRRPDGFHELVSVIQTLDLVDRLDIDLEPHIGDIDVLVEAPGVPGGDTLVTRAIGAVLDRVPGGGRCWVTVDKEIPVGGGLGGGSSDAAAALLAVNGLLGSPIGVADLHAIASGLGSDVPFFLGGAGAALVTGRGEQVVRVAAPPSMPWLLCNPRVVASTAAVYARHRLSADALPSSALPTAAEALRLARVRTPRNDLASAAMAECPRLARLVGSLRDAGADPLVAGSGATVAVRVRSRSERAAYEAVARQAVPGAWLRLARTTPVEH